MDLGYHYNSRISIYKKNIISTLTVLTFFPSYDPSKQKANQVKFGSCDSAYYYYAEGCNYKTGWREY